MFVTAKRGVGLIERSIRTLQGSFLELGLEFSPRKTVVIHFNSKNIQPGTLSIRIGDDIIPSSPWVKFLGIVFDYRLTFEHHVNRVRKRCRASINIMRFLCGTWWGADSDTLLIFFKSYVRSAIEYCIFAWYPESLKLRERLQKLQNAAIRAALGYRISTPINVMHAESCIVPLRFRARYLGDRLGDRFFAKVLSNRDLVSRSNTLAYFNIMAKSDRETDGVLWWSVSNAMNFIGDIDTWDTFPRYQFSHDSLYHDIEVDISFGRQLRDHPDPNSLVTSLIRENEATALFTDGSLVEGHRFVGAAAICPKLNLAEILSLDRRSSIYTAESLALQVAVDMVVSNKILNAFIFLTR